MMISLISLLIPNHESCCQRAKALHGSSIKGKEGTSAAVPPAAPALFKDNFQGQIFLIKAYELESTGEGGQKKFFHKPWAMTSLMFMGEDVSTGRQGIYT
eukprot:702255-Pelagomonas_calceolata.AAC.9